MTALQRAERTAILVGAAIVGLVIGWLNRDLLPARFFYDAERIAAFTSSLGNTSRDGSYQGTAQIFRTLGLVDTPRVVGLLTFILSFIIVGYCWRHSGDEAYRWPIAMAYSVTPILTAIFLFDYNKEVVVFALVLAFLLISRGWQGEAAWIALAVAYGLGVRQYWLLIAATYVALRLATRHGFTARRLALYVPVLLAGLTVAFRLILGTSANHYRTSVIEDLTVTPDSVIIDPFPTGNLLLEWLNVMHTWATLMVPYPLVGGNVQQLASLLLLATLWGAFWFRLGKRSGLPVNASTHVERCACLALAVTLAMSLFEPDYGSYVRHLLPVLPLVILTVALAGQSPSTPSTGDSSAPKPRLRSAS